MADSTRLSLSCALDLAPSRGSITIPDSVTEIGPEAFDACIAMTNVTIGNSVASIMAYAFAECVSLLNVTIPKSVSDIWDNAFAYCTSLTNVAIPNTITNMGIGVFSSCSNLNSAIIGDRITYLPGGIFAECGNLISVYFSGNAPSGIGMNISYDGHVPTLYYLSGTTGWSTNFAGAPTAVWRPEMKTPSSSFGVQTNQFGFNINWASGMTVVVEASTNLTNPVWYPIATNTLSGSSSYFGDPRWTNYPSRFYRLRWQ